MSDEKEKPLEIQILRNVKFVHIERTRIWCDTVIFDPLCNILPDEDRTIRGHTVQKNNALPKHIFTIFI